MKNRIIQLLCVIGLVGVVGCTQRLVDFTAISTKNLVMRGKKGPRVEGKDCVFIILFIPTGIANMEEAIDAAIESAGTEYNALSDGVLKEWEWWILVGQSCFIVEGTAYAQTIENTSELDVDADDRVAFHSERGPQVDSATSCAAMARICEGAKTAEDEEHCLASLAVHNECAEGQAALQSLESKSSS